MTLTTACTVTARFNGPSSIFISSPASGSTVWYEGSSVNSWYADVVLDGTAIDSEDGPLSGVDVWIGTLC